MLMPIYGYDKMPLLPLEEAVLPLVSIMPSIQVYVHVAKERCDAKPADGLTKDESASIILYTMEWEPQEQCLHFALNEILRAEDRRKLKPWFSYLKLILTALSQIPSFPRSVYCGVNKNLSKEYSKGKIFVWWGFSSCASCVEVLENEQFLDKTGTRTLFTIECLTGKDINRHSYYRSEGEFLLLPARQFQVISCLEPASGLHLIQIKELKPTIPLIETVISTIDTEEPSSEEKKKQSENAEKDVQPKNTSKLSETKSTEIEKIDATIDNERTKESIENDMLQLLTLSDKKKQYFILSDLFKHGRQSLVKYYDYLNPDTYKAAMEGDDSTLMKLLKKYFELQWKIVHSSKKWFILFLNEYKNGENHHWYEQVLTRTARYGDKFIGQYEILSIVLQLFFEGIDDDYLNGTNIFNELWLTVTQNGLKSITKYSHYIVEDVMNKLINKDPPVLFQAIREQCCFDLFPLLKECAITDKQNLYGLALDNIAEHGWKIGLQSLCHGRACAVCHKCRDYHYLDDRDSWNWIRNVSSWNEADKKRWTDNCIWKRFVRREGDTCHAAYDINSDIGKFSRDLVIDADDVHDSYNIVHYIGIGFCVICLCER
ncbi:unnamed protein product [Adineta steineri]|uniref:NAD(P)(+)--arginine ADP-ribosyltransferase n=1 Tax=Adineta steineri TaxID=433720 RepID=A0A815REG2_9BILA|nr:unnamed protein product [Adineta steineri]CAF1475685.1 unnamed protein product [Adineta steineri]CAF1637183.1 unnamed protein product [Adineta steineri]CAF1637197.1 unnamed protein product [Adineta steineri]